MIYTVYIMVYCVLYMYMYIIYIYIHTFDGAVVDEIFEGGDFTASEGLDGLIHEGGWLARLHGFAWRQHATEGVGYKKHTPAMNYTSHIIQYTLREVALLWL